MNNIDISLKMIQEGINYFDAISLLNEEMSTVGRSEDGNYKLMIYPEPLGKPSFHVKFKNEWEVVISISDGTILERKFGKYQKGESLPSWIQKEITHILTTYVGKSDRWEHLLITWNDNNPNYQIPLTTKIPF